MQRRRFRDSARRPNTRLAAARRARGLTQQELAEAVNAAHWALSSQLAAIDGNYVSKLERGVIARPHRRCRDAFRAALGAATDAQLGFAHYPRATRGVDPDSLEVVDVRRSQFLQMVAGLGVGAALSDPARLVGSAGRLGAGDVALVREVTVASRALRGIHGGAACSHSVAGQVRWALGLLDRPCSAPVRSDVHAAVGALASMAAWGEVDAGDHVGARRYHDLALYCAEQGRSGGLRAEVLKDSGLAALYRGRSQDALAAIELAQSDDRASPRPGQVLLGAAHARGLAAAGRPGEAAHRLLTTTELLDGHAESSPDDEAASGSYLAEASSDDLHYELALAAVDVAGPQPNSFSDAVATVESCLGSTHLPAVRRARLTTKLACLHLRHDDLERGLLMTDTAVTRSAALSRSRLLDADLSRLAATLRERQHPVARDHASRITTLVACQGA